ncbi:transcription factor S, partial [Candidatus Woesearchaeota archaeon]|nr:transcription factor S [Candidatus Woesearchaeota archaeon]
SCGHTNKKVKSEITETVADNEEVVIVDSDESPNPVVDAHCSRCGPVKAEFWMIQTRASDEPETQFFKCKKCRKVWKE